MAEQLERTEEITGRYAIYLGDCCEVMPRLPAESVHLSVYSPPFAGLYHYSSSERDLSNSRSYAEFFQHYEFVVQEIYRMTVKGRMTAVHCMDVPSGNSGRDHIRDFPGDIIRMHCRCKSLNCDAPEIERQYGECGHGDWEHIARYCVWKEPLAVRNRTMQKKLAHMQIVEDASRCGNASADYLLVFRRKGENPIPIEHPQGLTEYAGEREIPAELERYRGWTGKQIENKFSQWIWRQYASAFWDDVRIDRVLPYLDSRDPEDEKHVHPLQLDVIDRIITLWSNPDEIVLTPFMGVGSEVYSAVKSGRKALGIELKPSYFRQAQKNIQRADEERGEQMSMFSMIEAMSLEVTA